MFKTNFTNAQIAQIDWAQADRSDLLRNLHRRPAPRPVTASSGWGTDVAATDRRSVAAYLAGRGDLRTTWWNLFRAAYMRVMPGATIERAMYAFHRFHHALALTKLEFSWSVAQTATEVEQRGVVAAVRRSVVRELER